MDAIGHQILNELLTHGIGNAAIIGAAWLWLRTQLTRVNNTESKINMIAKQTHDLHVWHDREDKDGVKVWYMRQSLEEAITKLATNIELQTYLLQSIHEELKIVRAERAKNA